MRILGIDFGDRHVGLAVSDNLQLTAQPMMSYTLTNKARDARFFQDLAAKYDIERVVVGYPLRLDGTEGTRVDKTNDFVKWLEQILNLPVVLWDERLTTRQAQNVMKGQKLKPKAKKSLEHQISAALILGNYLESGRKDIHDP